MCLVLQGVPCACHALATAAFGEACITPQRHNDAVNPYNFSPQPCTGLSLLLFGTAGTTHARICTHMYACTTCEGLHTSQTNVNVQEVTGNMHQFYMVPDSGMYLPRVAAGPELSECVLACAAHASSGHSKTYTAACLHVALLNPRTETIQKS